MTVNFFRRLVALNRLPATVALILGVFLGLFLVAPAAQAQTVSLDRTSVSVPEGNAGTVRSNFQIRLSTASSVPITVTYGTADGSAVAGADYVGLSGSVTFAAGETLKSVGVDVIGDTLYEDNEVFSFSLLTTTGGTLSGSSKTASIVITNDDPQPTLSIADASPVSEGDGGDPSPLAQFIVTLSTASGKTTTVTYNTANISTTTADYTAISNGTLTFNPGETSKTISIAVTPDNIDETTEYFKVQLSNPVGAGLTRSEGLGTITDDDGPNMYFLGDATVSENDPSATLFVVLDQASPEAVTINYRTNDNSAIAGADYQSQTGTLTFSPGELTKALTIPLVDDNIQDGTKFFTVDLFGESGGVTVLDSQAIVTILDNEGQPTLSVSNAQVNEGTGTGNDMVFDVTMTPSSTQTVTVSYKSEEDAGEADPDLRAQAEVDFRSVTGTLTFSPGETSKQIIVPLIGDSITEKDEHFKVTLFNNVGAMLPTPSATGTIIDDDIPVVSVVAVAPAVNEGNSGLTGVKFKIKLSQPSPKSVTVTYGTTDGTAMVADNDYGAVMGTATFPVNSTTAQIVTVNLKGDLKNEADETFSLDLSTPVNCTIDPNAGSAIQTIVNDDKTLPNLNLTSVRQTEGSNGGFKDFVFTLSLTNPNTGAATVSGQPIDVAVSTSDGSGSGVNPAVAPGDYTPVNATVTIPANQSAITVTVKVAQDTLFESDESFTLSAKASGTLVNNSSLDATGTILDDDQANKPTVSIPAGPFVGTELDEDFRTVNDLTKLAQVNVPINLDRASGSPVNVLVASQDGVKGTDVNAAVVGEDYEPVGPQVVTFPPGVTTQNLTVYINGDKVNEKTERFYLNISGVTDNKTGDDVTGATLGNTKATVRILDNDKGGTVTFKGDPVGLFENAADGPTESTFDVTLSAAAGQDLTISYAVAGITTSPASTSDITTRPTETFGKLTIPAGQVDGFFHIDAVNDSIDEKQESFTVKITGISDSTWTLPTTLVTCTIADDDPGLDATKPFTPDRGYAEFSDGIGGTTNATQVTLTGNDFTAGGGTPRVFFTQFGDSTKPTLPAEIVPTPSATSVTVKVPDGALTGPIRVATTAGSVTTAKSFIVQPTVSFFDPKRGVPNFTRVTINGANFSSNLNPVTAVYFNGLRQPVFDLVSLGQGQGVISCLVPKGATSGKISVQSSLGNIGPDSIGSFSVDAVNPGGIVFKNPASTAVTEGDNVLTTSPGFVSLQDFTLNLDPAVEQGATGIDVPPLTGPLTVELSASATPTILGAGPEIAYVDPDTQQVVRGSTIRYNFKTGFDAATDQGLIVSLVNAGDDDKQGDATITVTAKIVKSGDTANYPTTGAGASGSVTVVRKDRHEFRVSANTLRTSETDTAPDPTKSDFLTRYPNFQLVLHNASILEPGLTSDGRQLTETVPTEDVTIHLKSSDTTEGLVSYFLMDRNTGKLFTGPTDGQPIPSSDLQVIFNVSDPTRSDYYLNPHIIVVTGQDDGIADSDQRYSILFDAAVSADPEYNGLTVGQGIIVVNTDNEQQTSGKGFVYSPSNGANGVPQLATNESGTTDSFTVALRAIPDGPVKLKLTSTNPSVVKLINPATQALADSITVTFTRKDPATPTPGTTRWDIPIRVSVQGVDDGIDQTAADGNDPQTVVIDAKASSDYDKTYNQIDPFDPIVKSSDNQTAGFLVTPTQLVVTEAQSDTFSVRLGSKPTQNVTVNLVSSSKTVATANLTRLVFTPTTDQAVTTSSTVSTGGWNVVQKVTVTGIDDGAPLGDRSAVIQLTASSGDSTYNVNPADVNVQVLDKDSATFTVNPPTVTVKEGETGSFQVKLNGRPSANVDVTFASNDASRVQLLNQGIKADTVTLSFTSLNYSTYQTVNFSTATDDDKNTDTVSVVSTVSSTDANYKTATPPQAQIVVTDTTGNSGGGGTTTFDANTTYTVSFPYMPTSKTTEVGTPNQVLSLPLFTNGVRNYHLYAFAAKNQDGSLLPVGSETGTFPFAGYTELQQGDVLSRGRGYILVNGANGLSLKVPGTGVVYASAATAYTVNLTRNTAGVTGGNSRNGLNLIGFPFNPNAYQYVDFSKSTVQANGFTYDSVEKAAAAGVMSPELYEALPSGKLSKVSSTQRYLKPFKAYFVQIFQDNVTLTLKNPTVVSGG